MRICSWSRVWEDVLGRVGRILGSEKLGNWRCRKGTPACLRVTCNFSSCATKEGVFVCKTFHVPQQSQATRWSPPPADASTVVSGIAMIARTGVATKASIITGGAHVSVVETMMRSVMGAQGTRGLGAEVAVLLPGEMATGITTRAKKGKESEALAKRGTAHGLDQEVEKGADRVRGAHLLLIRTAMTADGGESIPPRPVVRITVIETRRAGRNGELGSVRSATESKQRLVLSKNGASMALLMRPSEQKS